ncbi:hypothetical protein Tco_1053771 [Tanacetum coccineum]|uniref:Uncharacterized protein n=1 Tax=Tanacetum coccineum TaxID=301880 RepID=A0ABQ5GVS6_9ASTR
MLPPEAKARRSSKHLHPHLSCKDLKEHLQTYRNNLKTSSNTKFKNVDTSPRTRNEKQTGQFENQRAVTVAGNTETVETQKEDAGIQLSAQQSEWLHATDDEPEDHELEAHYMYMETI